ETALASYHTHRYTDAIPVLRQVLKLRPDNAVAAEHLRTATSRHGTTLDAARPVSSRGPGAWWWMAGGLLAALVLVAGLVMLARRRGIALPGVATLTGARTPHRRTPTARGVPVDSRARDDSLGRTTSGSARYCVECGLPLGQGNRFCGNCGHPADR
ncbi:MAG: hypothetical protein JWN52_5438, partial [Actinomycetia bacterium]|nr:hypothetical protein [Actinomycetes bacterium]